MPPIPSKIVELAIEELQPQTGNSRTHSKKQIRKLADSIRAFGFVNPVLIDGDRIIVAGHGRVEAARLLGMESVPTIALTHLTPDELRAYVIADNKLASLAGWDRELLAIEMASLAELAPELDLAITGFEVEEIEILIDVAEPKAAVAEPAIPAVRRDAPATTRLGDLWEIGRHRLLCGNALERSDYQALLGRERADVAIADPPYNVPIAGHVSGLGAVQHREFAMASGEMSRHQFQRFLSDVCSNLARFSRSGSLHYIFMDWRSIGDLLAAGEQSYDELLNLIVWVKSNGGMGALYRSRHELLALFKRGKRAHKNNVQLGATGRYRTNVWEYPGVNHIQTGSNERAVSPSNGQESRHDR
jgi:ParB-like chromosome segregation protein Spo0J